jgi:hypothetical protein
MDKEVKKLMAIAKMLGEFEDEDSICLAIGMEEILCEDKCYKCKWNTDNYKREDYE